MTANLQPYLPRLIRYWDQDAPGQLYRTIDGSMVFVDVSGFTKMSERLARHGNVGAEEVTEVIDRTFGQLLPEAYAFGANLLKFGGDALLLLFNGDAHPLRAVAAAHAMRAKLRQIGVFSTTAGNVSLRMSVGIHTGEFDFFLVGGSHRELIVAGPSATRIVMMESAAGPGQILLSPGTAGVIPGACIGREVGPGYLLSGNPTDVNRREIEVATTGPADLTPFIPVGLRQTLVSGRVEPEHRPAAVAFLHYGEFDRLVAERGPDDVAEALHHLVRTVQDSVESRGVTFMATDISGDGGKIILTAGVPGTTGNDEEQMLLALREIVNTAKPDFPLHIGLNWGHVFSGEVGPAYRRTYTIMGDAVNLAARLMAKAPAGEMYTTAGVLEGSRTTFKVTTPEPFYVKGKKLPIQAFSVGEPEGSRVVAGSAGLPLIGRDQELSAMVDAWDSAMRGEGRVVELAAEAGMGKSRLLEEFLATSQPKTVVRTECRLYQAATSYFPFRALLRGALGLENLSLDESEVSLRDLVSRSAPHLTPWLALIGRPLGFDLPESSEVSQLEDQFRPARTLASIGELLEATLSDPILFVIEDTHWMDDASRELLGGLMAGLDRLPWLIALTRRPGSHGFVAPEASGVKKIELRPLSLDEAKTLIVSASKDSPLLPYQVDTLAQRAEGNPLFLIELLQALRRGGTVEELPHSVEGMISARVDKLPPADRNLLRRVSVLGNGFRLEHSAAVLRENESDVKWQALAMRRLSDFLTIDQSGWVQFRHALIRDVAYAGLPFRTRQVLHARVGDSIRRGAGDKADEQAELLSLHYFYAKRWDDTWHFSRVAGDRAKEVYANNEAAAFYRRALQAARNVDAAANEARSELAESLGDVLEQAGQFPESLDAYRQATRLVTDNPIKHADLLLKRARARAHMGLYSTAFRELAIGCRIVTEVGSQEAWKARARLTALNAQLRQLREHPRTALKLAQQAMNEAAQAEEEEALARAYQVLDASYNMLGQPSRAIYGAKALAIYEQLGYLPGVAIVTNNLGGQAYFEGRWDTALDYYAKAQDAFHRAGNEPEAATSGANIGEVLVSQGKFEEAETVLSESVRTLRAHGLIDAAIFAEIQLARLHFMSDRAGAEGELTRVQEEAAAVGQTQSTVEAAIYRGLAMVRRGDPAAALNLLEEAEATAGGEAELYGSSLARVRAEALAALGRVEEAEAQVAAGLARARSEGLAYEEALLLKTEANLIENDSPDRRKKLEEANSLLQRLGVLLSG